MNPLELNEWLILKGCYTQGCLMNAPKAAGLLGMTYAKTNQDPKTTCIFETDHYKKVGVPQHFCLIRKDGKIVDPLDLKPNWKKNPYHIVSWRVFTKPQSSVSSKIELQELYVPKVDVDVSTPQQDETVSIPVTVTTIPAPDNSTANRPEYDFVADPYEIIKNAEPYQSGSSLPNINWGYKEGDNWLIKLIKDFINLWKK
jgi:hypothetical protein